MGGGGSSTNPAVQELMKYPPEYSNLLLAYTECLKIFDGKMVDSRRLVSKNIIKNHDFSQGLDSWHPNCCRVFIAPSEQGKSGGGYAVVTDRNQCWQCLEQDITSRVSAGVTYCVSAIVGVSGPLSGCSQVQATLKLIHQDSKDQYSMIAKIHVPKGEWELLKGSFVLQSMPKRVIFYLEGPLPGLNPLIKSVMICPLCPDGSKTDENVILNPQFDNGLNNWSGRCCNITLHDSLPKFLLTSDKVFAATSNRNQPWSAILQEITGRVHRKLVYEATAVVRIYGNDVQSANVHATLQFKTPDNREYFVGVGSLINVQATESDWAELRGKFLLNGSPSRVYIYLEGPPPGTDILLKSCVVKLAKKTLPCLPPPIENSSYGVNIIQNSELSCGTDNWVCHGKCTLSVRTGSPQILPPMAKEILGSHVPLSGRYMLVTDRTQSWMGPAQIITEQLKLFLTYQVSAWVKIGSGGASGPQSVEVGLTVDDQWVSCGQVEATRDRWLELVGSFRIEKQASRVMVSIQGPSPGVDLMVAGLQIFAVDRQVRFDHLRNEADKIRKRDVVLKFSGPSGGTLVGSFVSIKQRTNSFPLGCCINRTNIYNEEFVDFFVKNFNWAVFGNVLKWSLKEKEQGNLNYRDADEMLDLCQKNNIQLRGRYNMEVEWTAESWIRSLSTNDLVSSVQNRLKDILTHYKGKFKHYDFNNKMLDRSFYQDRLGNESTRAKMFQTARELDPHTLLFINDTMPSPEKYIKHVSKLQEQGAPIGGIGIQGHVDSPIGPIVCSTLDKLGALGLPIWFTELDVSSVNEHTRADDMEVMLREAFAHPAVEGVMLWGFWEMYMSRKNAHLVNAEGDVNEAGKRLVELKQEWTTNARGHVDERGEFRFRGFHGSYTVEVVTPNEMVRKTFVVEKDDSPLVVNIDI